MQVAATLIAALVVMLFSAPCIARSTRDYAAHCFQNMGRTSLSNELMLSRLNEAISIMENSELVAETLGEQVFAYFLANKRAEWKQYRAQVTPFELASNLHAL